MAQAVVRIETLPDGAIEAAAQFYADYLTQVLAALTQPLDSLVVQLPPAGQEHLGWRRAAVQNLARAHAPVRVNFVSGADLAETDRACAWIEGAPGVTGQLFALD